jgi:hypothetical protein
VETCDTGSSCSIMFGNLESSGLGGGGISDSENAQISAKIERENKCSDA